MFVISRYGIFEYNIAMSFLPILLGRDFLLISGTI